MRHGPSQNRGAGLVTAIILIAAAVLFLAPNLLGAWLGGLIGDVWATALSAIAALIGGLFGR